MPSGTCRGKEPCFTVCGICDPGGGGDVFEKNERIASCDSPVFERTRHRDTAQNDRRETQSERQGFSQSAALFLLLCRNQRRTAAGDSKHCRTHQSGDDEHYQDHADRAARLKGISLMRGMVGAEGENSTVGLMRQRLRELSGTASDRIVVQLNLAADKLIAEERAGTIDAATPKLLSDS